MTKIEYENGSVSYTVSGSDSETTVDTLLIVMNFLREVPPHVRKQRMDGLADAALYYAGGPVCLDAELYDIADGMQKELDELVSATENSVYREKAEYVTGPLTDSLREAELDVETAVYHRLHPSLEVLTIRYIGGHEDHINITGNSHAAILQEAVRQATTHDAHGFISPESWQKLMKRKEKKHDRL